jgi:hypothetical protein
MGRNATLLRGALLVDAVVFLTAALLNMGVWVPLGFAELRFAVPVWQAGIGEAIIGITLLVAGLTGWARLSWVAFWMSIVGIVFGLSSPEYREPHETSTSSWYRSPSSFSCSSSWLGCR